MKKYNVGIVGYGWVSGAHIAAINATSNAQVTAIWSSRPQDPAEIKRRHGGAIACHADLATMLANPSVDVVSICSYPYQHADQIVAAAKAGKHLIIEKPITLSLADARRVETAVEAAKVKACVCFEVRYSSHLRAVRGVIEKGWLGRLHYAEVDYFHGVGPWYGQFRWNTKKSAGGSSLLSAGCHALDALLLFMDSDVESVTSHSTACSSPIFSQYEYPTTSVTVLRFANGALGKVASVIDCSQPYYFHIHLVGSEGSLLDNKFHSNLIPGLDKGRWSELSLKLVDSGDVGDHPYQTQFQAFFDALDRGEEMPLTSLSDGMRTHRTVLAADLSAEKNRTVALSEIGG